jgi:3-methyladenine DNA glycosylase/8-oxoguanine DNA glycosylase
MPRTRTTTIKVSGPFSLAAAVDALDIIAPHRGTGGAYEGWHLIGGSTFNVRVRQIDARRLVMSVDGDDVERDDVEAAEQLVRRMFGLDLDADRFYSETSRDDRVLRRLQSRMLGVRPITTPTPLAALVWTLLTDLHGPERARIVLCRLGGGEQAADLARLDPTVDALRLGLEPATVAHLRMIGERGTTGAFGAELLRSMPLAAARNWLCAHADVGVTTADAVLVAGAGRRDVVLTATPQLIAAVASYYGVARAEARRRVDDLSRRWGEFATWAAYLLITAARRDGVSAAAST